MARSITPDRKVEQELRAKILAGSRDVQDYRTLGSMLLESGREEETLAVLERALDLPLEDTDRAAITAEVAWILYGLSQTERAMNMARTALSCIIPERADIPHVLMILGLSHATLAACQYYTDRVSSDREARAAIESLEQLVSGHPDFEDYAVACRHAAGVYTMLEEYGKAIVLYEKAMQGNPSQRNRLYCLVCIGRALSHQGRYAEGEARLREALELVEADKQLLPRIYFELGKLQRLNNRPQHAVVTFEQALTALDLSSSLRHDQDFLAEIKWELGNIYYDAKRYGEAISAFHEALPHLPEPYPYFDTLITLGHCYLVSGQFAKARDCYQEVLASDKATNQEKAVAQQGLSRLPPLPPTKAH